MERTRDKGDKGYKGYKLFWESFHLDIRKTFFTVKTLHLAGLSGVPVTGV